ncbi:serine hydrolase [Longispora sp. NPDC051575]|uniref:serine hydrolase n=1 Tax=Longispora sp. NPDC051575 TaxID=3154943 RepID=UPI003437143D
MPLSPSWAVTTRRTGLVAGILAVVTLVTLALLPASDGVEPPAQAGGTGAPAAVPRPGSTAPAPDSAGVVVDREGWNSWTLLDLDTGKRRGSANSVTETNNTESMVKVWIGADYIAGAEAEGRALTDEEWAEIGAMIRYSDDDAAETLWAARGGDAVIERLIGECGLTGTAVSPEWWSYTQITAGDAVTMLQCVLDRAKTSTGTAKLVDEMRAVDPSNAFGIPAALPAGTPVAVKNGWTLQESEDLWHVNCLATWGHWALSVLTWYPGELGQDYGAATCGDVTRQLLLHGLE